LSSIPGAEPAPYSVVVTQQLPDGFNLLGVAPAHGLCYQRLANGAVRVHEETQDVPARDERGVGVARGIQRRLGREAGPARRRRVSDQRVGHDDRHVVDRRREQRFLVPLPRHRGPFLAPHTGRHRRLARTPHGRRRARLRFGHGHGRAAAPLRLGPPHAERPENRGRPAGIRAADCLGARGVASQNHQRTASLTSAVPRHHRPPSRGPPRGCAAP
jgi:hypothetical protein